MLLIFLGNARTCFDIGYKSTAAELFIYSEGRAARVGASIRGLWVGSQSCKKMFPLLPHKHRSESLETVFSPFLRHLQFGVLAVTISR